MKTEPVAQPRTQDPNERLAVATERMYEAFAGIEPAPASRRCPVTVDPAEARALAGDVRTLPASLVARFVLKAGTTWGGPEDLRRVAPRILELAADQQLPVDRGLVWAKLRWAGWTTWPTYQVTTVREHSSAEWNRLLRADPRPAHLAHRWLRDAVNGVEGTTPYLLDWLEAVRTAEPAAHHRAATGHLVLLLSNSPLRPDLPHTVADLVPGHPEAAADLAEWLSGPRLLAALERAGRLLADTSDARRVGLAVTRLRRYQDRVSLGSARIPTSA